MNINMKDFVKNDIAYLPGAFLSLWLVCTFPVKMTAQTSDSIRTKEIDEVVVKARCSTPMPCRQHTFRR